MTKVAEEMVEVVCSGIAARQGFNVYPLGEASHYVEFEPARNKDGDAVSGLSNPVAVRRDIAEYLMSQDPSRFKIVGPEPKAPGVVLEVAPAKAKGRPKKV